MESVNYTPYSSRKPLKKYKSNMVKRSVFYKCLKHIKSRLMIVPCILFLTFLKRNSSNRRNDTMCSNSYLHILCIELGKFLFLFQCRVTKEFVHSNHKMIRHPFWKNSHICIDMRKTASRGHSCSEGLRKKVTKRNSYKRLISYNWFCGPNTAKAV